MITGFDINRDTLITDLSRMIRIPSINPFGDTSKPHPAEAAMADYLEARLGDLGFNVDSREVSEGRRNVWGTLKGKGGGPTILLAGHLDTVGVEGYDDPFEPAVKGGRIYGRGSCDMKAGLAAYLEVARLIVEGGAPFAGDLIIAGVIDEEHAMTGSLDFGLNGPPVDCAIVAEPTGLAICPAHKGQILMTIKTTGLAAHSSMPHLGRNAIYHMAPVVQALASYAKTLPDRTADAVCGTPSLSIGVIRGGDNACSVPDFCEIDIDRRTIPGEDHTDVLAELATLLDKVQADTPDMQFTCAKPFLNLPPLATPDDAPVMRAIKTASEQTIGRAKIRAFPGSTDAPHFRCPTVICGPGNLEQCHSLNEYVTISEIEEAVRIYLHAILSLQTA